MVVLHIVILTVVLLDSTIAAPSQDGLDLLKIPSKCIGERFCSIKPDGYELFEEKINQLLPDLLLTTDFDERIGEETPLKPPTLSPKEDWHNCPYETKTESIYTYTYENSTKMDIIVQTKLLRQHVQIVTCAIQHIDTTSSEQCFQELNLSAFGMKSSCVNGMATRILYVFDEERNKIIQKPFNVPACCKCKVSYD